MAQKQLKERMEATEKAVTSLKGMMLEMKKVMESIAEDVKENKANWT